MMVLAVIMLQLMQAPVDLDDNIFREHINKLAFINSYKIIDFLSSNIFRYELYIHNTSFITQ